jgi:hypothetical protein
VETLAWLDANAVDNGVYTVILDKDQDAGGNLFYADRAVTLIIKGYEGTQPVINGGFSVKGTKTGLSSGKTLNLVLQDVKVGGRITVGEYASLELKAGAEISGNTNRGAGDVQGGGVYVFGEGSPAALILNGGKIANNTVEVIGAAPSDNSFTSYARGYGGGVYIQDGSFIMNSGEISGNKVIIKGGGGTGAAAEGGGVFALAPYEFVIRGGTIANNTVDAGDGAVDWNEAFGGGVYIALTKYNVSKTGRNGILAGGTITGNTAKAVDRAKGGGLYIATQVNFLMTGGEISGNTVQSSASPNRAYGAGLYVDDQYTSFKKTGGFIAGYGSNRALDQNGVEQSGHGSAAFLSAYVPSTIVDGKRVETVEELDPGHTLLEDDQSGEIVYPAPVTGAVLTDGTIRPAGFKGSIKVNLPGGAVLTDKDTEFQQNYKTDPKAKNWGLRYNGVFLRIETVQNGEAEKWTTSITGTSRPIPVFYNPATDTWDYEIGEWERAIDGGMTAGAKVVFKVEVYNNRITDVGASKGKAYTAVFDTGLTVGEDMAYNVKKLDFEVTATPNNSLGPAGF